MGADYHCLIAGLAEYSFSDKGRGAVDLAAVRTEIAEQLSKSDKASLELLYSYYDVENLINTIQGSNLPFNSMGNLNAEQIQAEIASESTDDEPFESLLPSAVRLTLERYLGQISEDDAEAEAVTGDDLVPKLLADFYTTCQTRGSGFIKHWAETDRTIRNIIVMQRAQSLGVDTRGMIVGNVDEENFSPKDFVYYDDLMAVLATTDFVERETRMDALRWRIVEEMTEHDYFNISTLLGYLVRLNILYRWSALDKQIGEERLRSIVQGFKKQINIE